MAAENQLKFALFTSSDLDFLTDKLFTEMDFLTEQTETSETVNVAVITEESEHETERNGQQLDDQDVDNFIVENRNKNTTKKTQSNLNVFYKWPKSVNETRSLENIPEQELNKVLAHFFLKYENKTETNMNLTHSRQCYAVLTEYYENKENNTIYSPTDSL